MPDFEFTSPEGKKYTVSGPAGATKEQAFQMLQSQLSAPAAPSGRASDMIPGVTPGGLGSNRAPAPKSEAAPVPQPAALVNPQTKQDTILGKYYGPLEAATTVATGMFGGLVGAVRGSPIGGLLSGSNAKDAKALEEEGGKLAEALTYTPRTNTGNALVQGVGKALNDSGIIGIPIPELNALGRGAASSSQAIRGLAAPSALAQGAADAAASANPQPLRNLLMAPKPTMAGGGAAVTADEALRGQRFAQFGIKPTKGQLTRTMEDAGFEKETAKLPEGKAFNDRFAEQNGQVQKLFNDFVEQTGAEAPSIPAAGKVIRSAVSAKNEAKVAQFTESYKKARDAGEMAEPVDVSALTNFVTKNKGKDKLAPIISVIEEELKQNAKTVGGGTDALMNPQPRQTIMSLNATEDLRQAIGKLSEPDTPNVVYGTEAKKLIDAATESKGGPLFRQARREYENYSNEFTNRDVIDKLLRVKPGTKDLAVANEDVVNHLLGNASSTDDVRHVFRVLTAHSADSDPAIVAAGQQSARELRGAMTEEIKKRMFSNGGADTAGKVVGSEAKVKAVINELDADGKLEAIYGKAGAQTLRDVRDLAVDVYTVPNGANNSSNTAAKMVIALNKLATGTNATPVIGRLLGPATKYVARRVESNALSKKVDAALNPPQNALAQPKKP